MAKGTNQKLKLIYLIKIFMEKTDDTHSITMPEIIAELEKYDISAERKSIYADLEAMRDLGIDVIGEAKGKTFYYHVGSRKFELAELKLLVDAIQSSKFITEKKSRELIKKLESLTSLYEAKQLQRQVYVAGRVKTMNESIYYSVDEIHNAISDNKQLKFQYFSWNDKKEMELRKNGAFYQISPWALCWEEDNYYMLGFDAAAGYMKHYRVDKITNASVVDAIREGREQFEKIDLAGYGERYFGMFDAQVERVKLKCKRSFANVIIDRFGKDISIVPLDEEYFYIYVNVAVSDHFLGWVFAMRKNVQILGPEHVLEKVCAAAKEMQEVYQ
jgi:predicted DNA-binding transcriptional regulator YafY